MTNQPEALRMAECLEAYESVEYDAAAELRRLHQTLQSVASIAPFGGLAGMSIDAALIEVRRATQPYIDKSATDEQHIAAIAKATGEQA